MAIGHSRAHIALNDFTWRWVATRVGLVDESYKNCARDRGTGSRWRSSISTVDRSPRQARLSAGPPGPRRSLVGKPQRHRRSMASLAIDVAR